MKLLSLFSGSGGFDLGFEKQGFSPILAYDKKTVAVSTYNFNRKQHPVAKVANLADIQVVDQIIADLKGSNLQKDEALGVVGGPPCQYFSNGNKSERNLDDERRLLPGIYASILGKLNALFTVDFFIFENVDGLAKPKFSNDFIKIKGLFAEAGFHVSSTVLDAYNFNVPQHRKRVFIIGWNQMHYPGNTYNFPSGNPSGLTVRKTIEGLDAPVFFKKGLDPSKFPVHPNHWTMLPRSEKFNTPAPDGLKKSVRSFRRLHWDDPSYTVAYGHNEIHVHPDGNRRLSIYEAMLLQGFPKGKTGYRLLGGLSEQVSLVSDAVPPPLASALAASIKQFIAQYRKLE